MLLLEASFGRASLCFFTQSTTSDRRPCAMQNLALHNVHSAFSFITLINGYLLLILSLILHFRFAITLWLKTNKFLQALTTLRNGRPRMQRIIQTEVALPWVLSSLILIFQRSHQVSIELRSRWNFLTTKPSLRSVAYGQVSSAKRAR
jgi:hypothetical protein